jgi:hypothetical protein
MECSLQRLFGKLTQTISRPSYMAFCGALERIEQVIAKVDYRHRHRV